MKKRSFAVAYMRFSSEKQADGYSIEAQKEKIDEYAEKNNIEILEYFIDEAKKGSNDRREGFQQMKDYIEEEGAISYVLCHKRDRVFRSKKINFQF